MLGHYLCLALLNDRNDEHPEDSDQASAPLEHADEDGSANQELASGDQMEDNNIVVEGNFMRTYAYLHGDIEVRDDFYLARRVPDTCQVHIEPNSGGNLLDQVVPQNENHNAVSDRVQLEANLDDVAEDELGSNIMDMEEGLCRSNSQQ